MQDPADLEVAIPAKEDGPGIGQRAVNEFGEAVFALDHEQAIAGNGQRAVRGDRSRLPECRPAEAPAAIQRGSTHHQVLRGHDPAQNNDAGLQPGAASAGKARSVPHHRPAREGQDPGLHIDGSAILDGHGAIRRSRAGGLAQKAFIGDAPGAAGQADVVVGLDVEQSAALVVQDSADLEVAIPAKEDGPGIGQRALQKFGVCISAADGQLAARIHDNGGIRVDFAARPGHAARQLEKGAAAQSAAQEQVPGRCNMAGALDPERARHVHGLSAAGSAHDQPAHGIRSVHRNGIDAALGDERGIVDGRDLVGRPVRGVRPTPSDGVGPDNICRGGADRTPPSQEDDGGSELNRSADDLHRSMEWSCALECARCLQFNS